MTDQRTQTKPAWIVWVRVGAIVAAIGAVVALYGFISQTLAPIQIGQAVLLAGFAVAAVAGIWRIAAGRR